MTSDRQEAGGLTGVDSKRLCNLDDWVMEYQQEHRLLEQYALASNRKVFSSLSDLDPDDGPLFEMIEWCQAQVHIVVLHSGKILSSRPSERLVQNAKVVMMNSGLVPGDVYPATSELIQMLLNNDAKARVYDNHALTSVSTQQQRLRMLVKDALLAKASDIHIEGRPELARRRFRKHSEL